jgi:lipopolysaccharide/colanic/teichoic acid biosynthesis glycosyltransferase
MSLIGPRPERPFFVNRFRREIPNYELRLAVKPGITGLAQVRYKYDESLADVRNKLTYDLVYVKRMSWAMDARILFWTFGTVSGHNAN